MKKIIFLLLVVNYCAYSQTNKDSVYFVDNSVNLSRNELLSAQSFEKIGIVNSSFNYYFFGEIHYRNENIQLFKENFAWLNKYNNCNIIALEYSYSDEERLNRFISTGDTNIIKDYYKDWTKAEAVKLDSILHIVRRIQVTSNETIKIYCIDAEKKALYALWDLKEILNTHKKKNQIVSDNISTYINYVYKMYFQRKRSEKELKKFTTEMIESMQVYEAEYKSYLNEDWERFQRIINGMVITNREKVSFIQREAFLYNNFKKIIKDNPDQAVYTQLGSWHTTLLPDTLFANTKNLVNRLIINDSLKSKVCSIYPLYYQDAIGDYFFPKERKELLSFANNQMTLLRLDGLDTKYADFLDVFQYILILPRSLYNHGQ